MALNIAILSVHSCPIGILGGKNTGGMSVYIRELSRQLGKRGHKIDVYTRAHQPLHDAVTELGENVRLIHLKAGDQELDKPSIYPHLLTFARSVEKFRKEEGVVYDLINSHYWLSGQAGAWLQEWWNVPHVTMFHTLGAIKNTVGIGSEEPDLRIRTEEALVKKCQRIIAPTEKEKDYLITYYGASPKAIPVIPCGVNINLFRPVPKDIARNYLGIHGKKIALFVGRLVPLKGVDRLLMALCRLEECRRPFVMVIGGDEGCRDELERLKKLSRSLLIEDSVAFLGLVSQGRLPYFYSAADLCVFPSYYESFGLVALEALACGTPVVATDVGGYKEFICEGETGYVVPDNTPRHLAERITRITSGGGSNRETHCTHLIRHSVTRFSWSNIASMVEKEFEAVAI